MPKRTRTARPEGNLILDIIDTNIYKVQMEFVLSKVGGFLQNPPKLCLSFLFG